MCVLHIANLLTRLEINLEPNIVFGLFAVSRPHICRCGFGPQISLLICLKVKSVHLLAKCLYVCTSVSACTPPPPPQPKPWADGWCGSTRQILPQTMQQMLTVVVLYTERL